MKRAQAWTAAAVILLLVIAAGWWFGGAGGAGRGTPPVDPMVLKAPVATVDFADGSSMEIFGLAEDEWVDGVMSRSRGGWEFSTSKSGKYAFGQEKDFLQIERFTFNDKLEGVRLSPGAGMLVMSMRWSDPSGNPVSPESMKPGALAVRLSDGAGEWIDGSGPFGADDDPEARGVVSFAGWPRSGAELDFKAERAGHPPVEFRLPHPSPGATPAAWTAAPLPQVRSGDHWELRLTGVWETTLSGQGKVLVPEFEFASDLPESGRFPAIDDTREGVHGAKGTRSERIVDFRHGGNIEFGYPMPPDEDLFKFLARVQYEPSYPFPKEGVTMLATGTVAPDGKSIEDTSEHLPHGIESITVGPVEPGEDGWFTAEHAFGISFEGKWRDGAERSAAESTVGPWKEWTPVVFLAGGDHSSGAVQHDRSEASKGIAGGGSFSWTGRWSGDLVPGMKIEIGLMARKPDEVVEFVVDRQTLSAKPASTR